MPRVSLSLIFALSGLFLSATMAVSQTAAPRAAPDNAPPQGTTRPVPPPPPAVPAPVAAAQSAITQEETFFNARIGGRLYRLEGMISRPRDAKGRLPLAVILHGKDLVNSDMEQTRPSGTARQAADLARRGWLVASFVRRGFGRSDGAYAGLVNCSTLKLSDQFDSDAEETLAVMAVVNQRPDVDSERIIAIGNSAGGAASLALAARNPPGLKGIINIAGGLSVSTCLDTANTALVETAGRLGGKSKVPQLWLYADNDHLFPGDLVNRMHEAALAAGGDIRRVSIPKLEPGGHSLFHSTAGRRIWLAELDKSLRSWKLPTHNPQDVVEWTKALDGSTRTLMERYQADPGHKAMVHSPGQKRLWWRFAMAGEAEAIAAARKDCEANAKDCRVVLIGNALQKP